MKKRILVVEDEELKRITLQDALQEAGYEVQTVADGLAGLQVIENAQWDLVLTDLKLPGLDGLSLLNNIKRINPDTSVIVMTAYGTIDNAVEAMRSGAYDYITKPFTSEELIIKLRRLFEYQTKVAENIALRKALVDKHRMGNLIGKSKVMQEVFDKISIIAESDTTVLLVGETGTGKELVGETIHYNSPRREYPFIKLPCVTLTESIIESELFGHERGAFSGAIRTKMGRFEMAHKGTLFLDDIDDIPLSVQPKLLRVVQSKEFERVGGEKTIKTNVRVIGAVKSDLSLLVSQSKFREDLYYRLNTISLRLPPLRERIEDIPTLVQHFVQKYAEGQDRVFSSESLELLAQYDWPGNVRELEHVVEGILVMTRAQEIKQIHFPKDLLRKILVQAHVPINGLKKELFDIEKETMTAALSKFHGNISKAAKYLKIPRSTFRDRLKKLTINIKKKQRRESATNKRTQSSQV
jgi:DNA-binding NtrC family response regulator